MSDSKGTQSQIAAMAGASLSQAIKRNGSILPGIVP
ncbi:Uncharacterised protein [Burkholderia pseudomallei]|nr:hypothetical protein DP58_294 [Burkholderia pseudomallei]AIP48533.1 hypothetical protein DR56_3345 [Burkholderia pseudomallei MSHR5858]AIP61103.1 hypothetical protein DR54_984 [Burkholderia pseudomallei HBPUB10303a]AJX28684.1 hypothetical protein AQ15_2375 [Burkholderia pseudomallei K96243]AIO86308.1 hypothetical protein DP46_417 [Burkholderia pseudomallei]